MFGQTQQPEPTPMGHEDRGAIDVSIMLLIHEALRRDLARLAAAVAALISPDDRRAAALAEHWGFVSGHLHHHHHAEDDQLWPLLRHHIQGRPADLEVLEVMEAEHGRIDPLVDAVTTNFAQLARSPGPEERVATSGALSQLASELGAHLDREERQAIPVITANLTGGEYASFTKAQQRAVGIRGAARFFPWILDNADAARATSALRELPAPLRLACRRVWQPAYLRRSAPLWT